MSENQYLKGELLIQYQGLDDCDAVLLLAHGAGAAMDSEFMDELAAFIARKQIVVVRFEFPYMHERRLTAKKRPPDRAPKLIQCFHEAIDVVKERFPELPLFIGGKSMGGRMASMIAVEAGIAQKIRGCLCFGYPYHAPGKPEKVRNAHFVDLQVPVYILQGDRDAFGSQVEVETYTAHERVSHSWLLDGNHDFKPRKAAGVSHQENIEVAANNGANWIRTQL